MPQFGKSYIFFNEHHSLVVKTLSLKETERQNRETGVISNCGHDLSAVTSDLVFEQHCSHQPKQAKLHTQTLQSSNEPLRKKAWCYCTIKYELWFGM